MHVIRLLFPLFLLCLTANTSQASPIALGIDHSDGGKAGKRHSDRLVKALAKAGCSTILQSRQNGSLPQLLFDPRPVSVAGKGLPNYRLIARARTLDGKQMVRGAILVHASTGIDDLKTLQGKPVAFLEKESWIGYLLPLKTLNDAGVTEQANTFFHVNNHTGTVSALLHNDVFVAITAEPLARGWAEANDLSIVALTEEVETGGWWAHKELPQGQAQLCAKALEGLKPADSKALPAWIGGFTATQ
jgi:ABC-type phosphate/phosphonate transport system substrate-binding protein